MLSKELIIDYLETPIGHIPIVPRELTFKDRLGSSKMRLNINRMRYVITPGLYAVGNPNENSNVYVSANYKMSFDSLRKELQDIDAWIVVLDTKGINVWCAAGKGTFGTEELIHRIRTVNLEKVVNHRQLIVPQLGATGVSAHEVKNATGFKIIYGPIRAADLPAFHRSRNQATSEMRRVRFNVLDRLVLIPLEVVQGIKYLIVAMAVFFVLSGLTLTSFSVSKMVESGIIAVVYILCGFLAGTVLTPLFLPYIPGRAFSLKGFIANGFVFVLLQFSSVFAAMTIVEKLAWLLITSATSSFFAMNFTGASTYTSLSGVKKEMRIAVPLQIVAFGIGFILWIITRFV